jgi:hypothetical protein
VRSAKLITVNVAADGHAAGRGKRGTDSKENSYNPSAHRPSVYARRPHRAGTKRREAAAKAAPPFGPAACQQLMDEQPFF